MCRRGHINVKERFKNCQAHYALILGIPEDDKMEFTIMYNGTLQHLKAKYKTIQNGTKIQYEGEKLAMLDGFQGYIVS